MGCYIYVGIATKIIVEKRRGGYRERIFSTDEILDKLAGQFNLDLYNIAENSQVVGLALKDKVIESYLYDFLYEQSYDLECGKEIRDEIEKLKNIYGAKNKIMQEEMAKNFHPSVKYTKPEGGMFVWVTLPNGVDMMKFVGEALENKVALVPGTAFLADTSMPCQSFRMNFSTPSVEDIIKGIRILGELTYKYCK